MKLAEKNGFTNLKEMNKETQASKFIMDKFIIKAIMSLPRNTFVDADTTTKTSILYLKKKKSPEEKQHPIFMAISNNVGHSDSGRQEPESYRDWETDRKSHV